MVSNENITQEGQGRYRQLDGLWGQVVKILAIGVLIYAAVYLLRLVDFFLGLFNHSIYLGSYVTVGLGLVLCLVFLFIPATKRAPRYRLPWYDLVLMLISLAGTIYVAITWESLLIRNVTMLPLWQIVLSVASLVAMLEAVRRTTGWSMVIIALFFLFYAKFAYLVPGAFNGPYYSWHRVIDYMFLSDRGVFGKIIEIAFNIIVVFLTFSAFLSASGAAEVFNKFAMALVGKYRGGAAKISILASCLLGTLTGSPTANVAITGSFTIPLMMRAGYGRVFAGAVEAAASTGGTVMPPIMGSVAFVMADFLQVSYGSIAMAAVIPALLYYLALYIQVDLRAASKGLKGVPKSDLPEIGEVFKGVQLWVLVIPLGLLVYLLMFLKYEPAQAAYFSSGLLLLMAVLARKNTKISLARVIEALEDAGKGLTAIVPTMAISGVIVGAVSLTGIGLKLANILLVISGGSLVLLAIFTGLVIYILGMGVSAVASYIILATLVAPAMVQMGVPQIAAHFFIFYMGTSIFITPPLAPAAFVAANLSGANFFPVGFQAMRLAIVTYLVTFIIVFNPVLLMQGTVSEVLVAAFTALVAVYALSVGIEGWFRGPINWLERLLWLAGGLLLFIPSVLLIAPGGGLLLLAILLRYLRTKGSFKERPDPLKLDN